MRRFLTALCLLLAGYACATIEPVGTATAQLEGGTCSCDTWYETALPLDTPIYSETPASADHLERPAPLLRSWLGATGQPTLTVGASVPTLTRYKLFSVNVDADDRISLMTDGRVGAALRDHATLGEQLWYFTLRHMWFSNTLYQDVLLQYQGNSAKAIEAQTGVSKGNLFELRGQGVNDNTGDTGEAYGGDVLLSGGAGEGVVGGTYRGGDVVLRGGRTGAAVTGGVRVESAVGVHIEDGAPSADPPSGGYLYSSGGALYWRGSAGTVTQLAAP